MQESPEGSPRKCACACCRASLKEYRLLIIRSQLAPKAEPNAILLAWCFADVDISRVPRVFGLPRLSSPRCRGIVRQLVELAQFFERADVDDVLVRWATDGTMEKTAEGYVMLTRDALN